MWTEEMIAKLREMCVAGTPIWQIAAALYCSTSSVYHKCSELGITRAKLGFANNSPVTQQDKGFMLPMSIKAAYDALNDAILLEMAKDGCKATSELYDMGISIAKAVDKFEGG